MSSGQTELDTYSIDDVIKIPVSLRDEDGVAHVRVVFRRMRRPGGIGPRGLDPEDTLELRGNGRGEVETTVEATLKVADGHRPGEYLCVAIQAYDTKGNMVMIKNPTPTRLFKIVDLGNKDDKKTTFLGWGSKSQETAGNDNQ